MNPQEEAPSSALNNELFQAYAQYQLLRVKNDMSLWNTKIEKEAIVNILESCQKIDANTFRALVDDLFQHSTPLSNQVDQISVVSKSDTNTDQNEKDKKTARTIQKNFVDVNGSSGYSDSETSEEEKYSVSLNSTGKRARAIRDDLKEKQPSYMERQRLKFFAVKSLEEIYSLDNNLEQAKRAIHARMKDIMKSVRIDYTLRIEDPNQTTCDFHFSEYFPSRSPSRQCQNNLIAFKLARITESEKKVFSPLKSEANKKRYFKTWMMKTDHSEKGYSQFPRYCARIEEVIETVGVYSLFIPEVASSIMLKQSSRDEFLSIMDYMNENFSKFKDIATADESGDFILGNIEESVRSNSQAPEQSC